MSGKPRPFSFIYANESRSARDIRRRHERALPGCGGGNGGRHLIRVAHHCCPCRRVVVVVVLGSGSLCRYSVEDEFNFYFFHVLSS